MDSWEGHFCLVNGEYAGNEDGIHLEGQDLIKVCGGGRVDPLCWTERGGSYEYDLYTISDTSVYLTEITYVPLLD